MNTKNATTTAQEFNKTQAPRDKFLRVDPRNIIVEDGFNVRQDYGDIDGLAEAIIENGQQVPLIVVKHATDPDKYVLTDGHRRLRAVNLAIEKGHDFPYVNCLLSTASGIEARLLSMLVTGTGNKPFTPVEEAEAYQRLINRGYSTADIAKRVGKSLGHVTNMLELANAEKETKNMVASGEVSATTVINAMKEFQSPEEVTSIVKDAVADAKARGKKKANAKAVTKAANKKAASKGDSGTTKVIKAKSVTIAFLKSAFELAGGEDSKNVGMRYLFDLIIELEDPEATKESVAEIFKK